MVGSEPALDAAPAHLELFESAPTAAVGGSWLSTNKFKASTAYDPSSNKDVTSTSASLLPAPDKSALGAAACVATAGGDLVPGIGAYAWSYRRTRARGCGLRRLRTWRSRGYDP